MLNRHLVPSENRLAEFDSATMVPAKFRAYIKARAKERPVLSDFYTNTMTTPGHTQYTIFKQGHPLHRKLRLDAFLNQKKADLRYMNNQSLLRPRHLTYFERKSATNNTNKQQQQSSLPSPPPPQPKHLHKGTS
ncbi:hypothetical protein GGI09_001298 [Coemansia sp. S100]|nr:hypothetical protein GGI09_001298 [Coemansia sp. S100]